MDTGVGNGLKRRDFLQGAALLGLVLGLPVTTPALAADAIPTGRQLRVLDRVSDIVIPQTGTPGALATGVPAFVVLALAHGLGGTGVPVAASESALRPFLRADGTLRHLDWLEATLDQAAGSDFLRLAPLEQVRILTGIDNAAFPPGPPLAVPSPWASLKGLILTGYYTSQAGAAQELRYELVPGRWDPDVPLKAGDSAWSNDWTAVEFG
ncbi:gluconate 2-dehydrogenase subunit 3 family protein [Novosphingobium sp. FKTRR1]|uniref:gluconate 2-dehydrogenase subunit 3 family protein n=1 Tax=Novosphingobium sp. FKTRR1 TaxID=2879118 RepID=UPI001CEFE25C|nr:gluconate 2-dehydrogenase subunit 3 family protein [Novosphingobium sp. FKTRR1]